MGFYVVAVGKIKDSSLREACEKYASRVRRYAMLEIVEVKDGGRTDKQASEARSQEGRALMRALPDRARIVVLTRTGVGEASSQLARRLGMWRDEGMDVAFVIGGPHGLADRVVERADFCMSISKMTFPHELARLVLLEQLYRVCTIWRGEPYHKGG